MKHTHTLSHVTNYMCMPNKFLFTHNVRRATGEGLVGKWKNEEGGEEEVRGERYWVGRPRDAREKRTEMKRNKRIHLCEVQRFLFSSSAPSSSSIVLIVRVISTNWSKVSLPFPTSIFPLVYPSFTHSSAECIGTLVFHCQASPCSTYVEPLTVQRSCGK